ncbi:MAG: Fe-S cluster assembly protein SufD [Rhizomicrobium sp.]
MTLMLPTRRVEEWKYSDLARALGDRGFGEDAARADAGPVCPGIAVFALDDPQRPAWVARHYGKLGDNAVSSVSLAKARGGIALKVAKDVNVSTPLTLDVRGQGHVRALLVLEEGARLTLLERVHGQETRNMGFEIVLARGASLDHVRLAPRSSAVQVEEVFMTLAAEARYRAHFACFGARLSRLELSVALQGEGGEAHLSGVTVLAAAAHADVTTHILHQAGKTTSSQLFRQVVGSQAQAIYQGKITVAPLAGGSDSRQTAKALLLGDGAEADIKPELEILADDVKCAHGAAVGDLDADSLFYLRARGISEKEARHLLIHAFLEDAVAQVADTELRETVRGQVSAALDKVTA